MGGHLSAPAAPTETGSVKYSWQTVLNIDTGTDRPHLPRVLGTYWSQEACLFRKTVATAPVSHHARELLKFRGGCTSESELHGQRFPGPTSAGMKTSVQTGSSDEWKFIYWSF